MRRQAGSATVRVASPGVRRAFATAATVLAFALYAAMGLARFARGRTGNFDLGIFTQAAQRWSRGELPGSGIRGLDNLFADHVSPVTVLFGAAWRVWADPRSLIIAQALALATAIGLIALAALRHLPAGWAVGVVAAATLSKGIVAAAGWDVHEVAFGVPLMAGLCWGVLERRRGVVVACALALLAVKEDLGLTVVAAGGVWWWRTRDLRTASLLAGCGVAGLAVAASVVAWTSPEHTSPYLRFFAGGTGNPQALWGAVASGGSRLAPVLLFALAAGVLGLRSPIAWIAAPTLLWRAASSNPSYWQTYFHYDAILVPVAAFALVDVLRRVALARFAAAPGAPRPAPTVVPAVVLGGAGLVAAGLVAAAWMGVTKLAPWRIWDPAAYRLSDPMRDVVALGQRIPAGAAVVAQQDLGPMLLARLDVRMLSTTAPGARAQWVILSATGSYLGAPEEAKQAWLLAQVRRPGVTVTERGRAVLVRLPAPEQVLLPEPSPAATG